MEDFLFALFRLLFWPYRAWKESLESSRVGVSESDRETLRFWKRFAMITSILVVLGIVGVGLYLGLMFFVRA